MKAIESDTLFDDSYFAASELDEESKNRICESWIQGYPFLNNTMSYEEMNERINRYILALMAQNDLESIDTKES